MKKLPIKTPAKLFDLLNIKQEIKYTAIYYHGTNPTWNTGYSMRTLSYYGLYEPMINHLALVYHLGSSVDLGSDDFEPSHALIFKRNGFISVIDFDRSIEFLENNNPAPPALTQDDIDRWLEELQKNPANLGMLEIFDRVSPKFQSMAIDVIQDLDKQVTKEMLDNAIELSKSSPPLYLAVNRFMSRIERTIRDNN